MLASKLASWRKTPSGTAAVNKNSLCLCGFDRKYAQNFLDIVILTETPQNTEHISSNSNLSVHLLWKIKLEM